MKISSVGCAEAKVVGKESHRNKKWITKAITIRKQEKTMSRDEGQYILSHMSDNLLKSSVNAVTKKLVH